MPVNVGDQIQIEAKSPPQVDPAQGLKGAIRYVSKQTSIDIAERSAGFKVLLPTDAAGLKLHSVYHLVPDSGAGPAIGTIAKFTDGARWFILIQRRATRQRRETITERIDLGVIGKSQAAFFVTSPKKDVSLTNCLWERGFFTFEMQSSGLSFQDLARVGGSLPPQ